MSPTAIPTAVPTVAPTAIRPAPVATVRVTNEQEHEAAIAQLIAWNQAPGAADNPQLEALADAVAAYEEAAGHRLPPPQTLRGILKVEMFKRRIRQRQLAEILNVTEPRLSELMKGRRELNLDFARRLHTILHIPAEVVLRLSVFRPAAKHLRPEPELLAQSHGKPHWLC